ncbi:MAG TPA: hypothetical protein VHC22_25055 [Pirellulales bacterium]|nr:hypothetical protein [Pirellulales bacterium]
MSDVSPYAAPIAEPVLDAHVMQATGGVWRDGNTLVMWKGAVLPDRCVRCNTPTTRRLKRTLYWHHPLVWLVIVAGVLVYVIVALVVRKKAVVRFGFCDRHYKRRLLAILAWWVITLACVASVWYGVAHNGNPAWPIWAAILVFFGNLLFAVAITRPVAPTRIDDQYVWLKKIHPDFLANFAPVPE